MTIVETHGLQSSVAMNSLTELGQTWLCEAKGGKKELTSWIDVLPCRVTGIILSGGSP